MGGGTSLLDTKVLGQYFFLQVHQIQPHSLCQSPGWVIREGTNLSPFLDSLSVLDYYTLCLY